MTQIKLRRGTAAQWTAANPTLSAGEAGLETDTGHLKFGNGANTWVTLPYFIPNHVHDAAAITTGVLDPDRIPLASGANAGGITASQWSKMINTNASQITYQGPTVPPGNYPSGVSWHTIDAQTGWPHAFGTVMTVRADGINPRGYQMLYGKDTSQSNLLWMRFEYEGDSWSAWNNLRVDDTAKGVTFLNSWSNFNSTSYENLRSVRTTGDLVSVAGMPKPGTIQDGIGICRLTSAHIPLRDAYANAIARTSVPSNVAVMVAVRGSGTATPGEVQVFGMPTTTSYLGIGFTFNLGG